MIAPAFCGVDPRGIGESATDKAGWVFAVSLLLGENFVGRQAWDVVRVIDVLRGIDGISFVQFDERDVVRVRSNIRGADIRIFPSA